MKKIIAIVFAFVCVFTYGQTKEQLDSIYSAITTTLEKDDLSRVVRANYELVHETKMSAESMYKNLMSVLYKEKTAQINEVDGKYQITTTDTKYDARYDILIKDNKFKITALMNSKDAYKYNGDALANFILKLPQLQITAYAKTILKGAEEKFDF